MDPGVVPVPPLVAQRERAARRSARSHGVKELRLRSTISSHDLHIKARKAVELLTAGHPVQLTVTLKGRLIGRPEDAVAVLDSMIGEVGSAGEVVEAPRVSGRSGTAKLRPAKTS